MPSFWVFSLWTCSISLAFIIPALSADSPVDSYVEHCSDVVPKSSPKNPDYVDSFPYLTTSYFTGGRQLLGHPNNNNIFYYAGNSLRLRILPDCHETDADGVYKIRAYFHVRSPYVSYYNSTPLGDGYSGSYYRPRRSRGTTRFLLTGYWSVISRKGCMVGSGYLSFGETKTLISGALKLQYPSENSSIHTAVASGTFQSTSAKDGPGYFDPISMVSFPDISNYNYSLLLDDEMGSLQGDSKSKVSQGQPPPSLEPGQFCATMSSGSMLLEMKYAVECNKTAHCSPLGNGVLPNFLLLSPIHCSTEGRKTRYIVRFENKTYSSDESFTFESTLIAEGVWDDRTNHMLIGACRVLDPKAHFGDSTDDCRIRLQLKYPKVWTINSSIDGQLWSTGKADEDKHKGYFRNITLTDYDMNDLVRIMGQSLSYEYTERERVRKSCSFKHPVKKNGEIYPDGKSNDMRFDASVLNSKGKIVGYSYATPLFVENELFQGSTEFNAMAPAATAVSIDLQAEPQIPSAYNISYRMSITFFVEVNSTMLHNRHQVEIRAEGVYNGSTGQLCMVGCKILSNASLDCEIHVKFDFAPLSAIKGDRIKGTIVSKRQKSDPLYFENLVLSATAFYTESAEATVWRMDLEITLVLISNTLFCIFVGLQIFHTKRNPGSVSSTSLVMVLILALGYMIPLVLNVEAVFLDNHNKQTVSLSSGGWVESNEVAVRVIMMVAFLLQTRLLQLVWAAKQGNGSDRSPWNGERKASFITLPFYILGTVFALLLNWMRNRYGYQNYSLWGDLRSYTGLILDGFLFPQIVLNAVRGSTEKPLSHSFYVGTSAVRLVPHAYNQYRIHSYPAVHVNGTYFYANPVADFYSTAWDVVIPLGVVTMAVTVFLQQRRGGRCILPQRFRELELYAKVPTADSG